MYWNFVAIDGVIKNQLVKLISLLGFGLKWIDFVCVEMLEDLWALDVLVNYSDEPFL
jgi:hypothetical protein